MPSAKIITVGFCPCWDITCYAPGIDWGEHGKLSWQSIIPAGKALNISRALAYIGDQSTAAGLWGQSDSGSMLEKMTDLAESVDIKFTFTPGETRKNVTVVDTAGKRQMHLRAVDELATKAHLMQLGDDLSRIVSKDSICVFAGSMPGGELTEDVLSIVNDCASTGARIVVDSSGTPYEKVVESAPLWLIKPNIEELCDLVKVEVDNEAVALIEAARTLLGKSELVLISRGAAGALVVSEHEVMVGKATPVKGDVINTVGCGDYLLAGFLSGMNEKNELSFALERAIKLATVKALGWTEKKSWADASDKIDVVITSIDN